MDNVSKNIFSNKHTNIVKGVAVILLLFYHLFYIEGSLDGYVMFFSIEKEIVYKIVFLCHVCVQIFTVLSGYGLLKSADKKKEPVQLKFAFMHVIKLLFMFWFIYLLFVPLGFWLGRNPMRIYGTGFSGLHNFFIDFFGVAELRHTPTMNVTWWYMGEILRAYIFFPVLYYGVKTNPLVMLIMLSPFCINDYDNVLYTFTIGMLIADKNLLEKYMKLSFWKKSIWIVIIGSVLILLRTQYNAYVFETVFAVWVIMIVLSIVNPDGLLGKVLAFLGKHSANVFMLHTFIYYYYFSNFIYSFRSPYLILIVLLLTSLLASIVIEWLKKILRYGVLEEKVKQAIINISDRWASKNTQP